MVRAYMTEAGFDVIRLKGLACKSPRLIAQVTLPEIRAALRELDGDDVDALLQVGTALPTVAVAAEAERWLGKPVLAINTVSYWNAIRRCRIEDRVLGLGRILEEH
jgi:maleate isomerase